MDTKATMFRALSPCVDRLTRSVRGDMFRWCERCFWPCLTTERRTPIWKGPISKRLTWKDPTSRTLTSRKFALTGPSLQRLSYEEPISEEVAWHGQTSNGPILKARTWRGPSCTGAELSEAQLKGANVRKADLVGANLKGADLSTACDLTQEQLNATSGDNDTRIPAVGADGCKLTRPRHWSD